MSKGKCQKSKRARDFRKQAGDNKVLVMVSHPSHMPGNSNSVYKKWLKERRKKSNRYG